MYRFRLTILLVFSSLILVGQEINVEKYKYIIVSDKFHFLKKTDQYQTSSLTKFLLKKKGFPVFLSSENFPEDLTQNGCLALYAEVTDDSSLLRTKLIIRLKDCKGNNIYTSNTGTSRQKDYKKAYQEAIRNAFDTMTDFDYNYQPSQKQIVTIPNQVDTPKTSAIKKPELKEIVLLNENLYAQPIPNGFQLVNTIPEVVYILLKTGLKEVFLLKNKSGIVYKSAEKWMVDSYQNDTLTTKELKIKF